MSEEDLKCELSEVNQELEQVQAELSSLRQRQSRLNNRKEELTSLLESLRQKSSVPNHELNRTNFPWSDKVKKILEEVFHIKEFRPLQLQAINATLSEKDCILILPTGGGKSLCYQLPALVKESVTIVVSPLVSLMEDQTMALNELGVKAVMLNADCPLAVIKETMDAISNEKGPGKLRLIYVTPEKLAKSKTLMNKLEKAYHKGLLTRFAIDEVHCCSQWGHDFRPDYKFLNVLRRQFPGVPILGLTATATDHVLKDVQKMLGIPDALVLRASYNRPNLYYEVRQKSSTSKDAMMELAKLIKTEFSGLSGIVYCLSQKDSEEVASELQAQGIRASCYHASMNARARSSVHSSWIKNDINVVVATIAFGMGIDKANVRYVVHYSLSKSLENYYQESGRAGRDGERADCILFWRYGDLFRLSGMVFAEQTGLPKLYAMVRYCLEEEHCRRALVARHFAEVWTPDHCTEMCDICDRMKKGYSTSGQDITELYLKILQLLRDQADNKKTPRITGLRLVELMCAPTFSKVARPLLPHHVTSADWRSLAERTVAWLLMEYFLKEDFHFTPYSTISYVVPGSRAQAVRNGKQRVQMPITTRSGAMRALDHCSDKVATCSASSSGTGDQWLSKPTLSYVNPLKSKFVSSTCLASPSTNGDDKEVAAMPANPKKRRRVEESSEDDSDEDLDFGDSQIVVRLAKKNNANSACDPVIIDSD